MEIILSRLLENDSLELLSEGGLPVPRFEVCTDADEAARALERLGGRVVIKALVPVGKRGKAGAVKFAASVDEARAHADAILGMEVRRFPVKKLIVMEALDIAREIFCSISFDAPRKCPLILFSAEGGVDIEELSRASSRQTARMAREYPQKGLLLTRTLSNWHGRAGLTGDLADQVARAVVRHVWGLLCP